jgi:hypothetical protein
MSCVVCFNKSVLNRPQSCQLHLKSNCKKYLEKGMPRPPLISKKHFLSHFCFTKKLRNCSNKDYITEFMICTQSFLMTQTTTRYVCLWTFLKGMVNNGTTTLSITTFSITTLSITTLSIMTFSIMTFSTMPFSIMTISIMTLSITFNLLRHSS